MDLVDSAAAILDTNTVALSTAAGAFSQAVAMTLGTTKYDTIVKIAASYTATASSAGEIASIGKRPAPRLSPPPFLISSGIPRRYSGYSLHAPRR